jgi:hypothetical protein
LVRLALFQGQFATTRIMNLDTYYDVSNNGRRFLTMLEAPPEELTQRSGGSGISVPLVKQHPGERDDRVRIFAAGIDHKHPEILRQIGRRQSCGATLGQPCSRRARCATA